jgi:pimeloyl-ACP methyl ester carboxylesterase
MILRRTFPGITYPIALVLAALGTARAQGGVDDSPPAHRGLVMVVGGVGGFDFLGSAAKSVLPRSGLDLEVQEFTWTHGTGQVLRDLQDYRYTQLKTQELAEEVRSFRQAHAGRPVYLVGKSGGAGLVLGAAEQLPEGALERIILLSPAVSRDYDLRPALRSARQEMVVFYSPLDLVVLGWGTKQFGTIDRYYESSAGLSGFLIPGNLSAEDARLYARLLQIRWHPHMIRQGNLGGHLGTSMPAFVAHQVAPWLRP